MKRGIIPIFFLLMILLSVNLVISAPAIKDVVTVNGYEVLPTIKDFIRTGEDHEFELHVINASNGVPITSGIGCYMHLYFEDGDHVYEGYDDTVSHDFDYAFNLNGTNFTSRGMYQAKFQCNNSVEGGASEIEFGVNDYGEALTEQTASTHNYSMIFLMCLFTFSLIGIIKFEHPVVRFALYWVCHVLFVAGTFAVWQFNQGYALSFIATAGIFKVLFYVSIFAMLPMMIFSVAWIIIIFAQSRDIQNLIDRGATEEEAWERLGSQRRRR
jgi:hypothetical protein